MTERERTAGFPRENEKIWKLCRSVGGGRPPWGYDLASTDCELKAIAEVLGVGYQELLDG